MQNFNFTHSISSTFNSTPLDSLPPENIESEEAILGGILLDTEAIFRVWDKLQPEHFYINDHRDIYKACIKLARNNKSTDLLTVTNYLSDHGKLEKIGGRNKLASLLDRTVSAVNIDRLADLVIEKFVRRQLISLGNELMHLGYQTHSELAEILKTIKQKTEWFTNCPWGQTEKEFDRWHYDQLLNKLQSIHRNIADPGFKIWKLQQLAKQNGKTLRDLENIYQKSLCAVVEPRQTLDQIEASVGGSAREFLLNGLAPKGTSILLYADGGVGKTKFLYDICHSLSTGQNWNGFPVTAPSRKILLYQGDESKRDMVQALNKRGFKPGTDARENLQVRFGWNFDAIPLLVQDIQEFQPDIVFIDSMTYANRFSIYDENRTEYARPVLELTAIAQEYGVTIVIVHHSSRGSGKPRGTTAIFNAVSEVLKLERDTSIKANGQEKILTIEKSRSRRFPCQYRLFFNEEDFSFSLLEEIGQEMGSPDLPLKDRIVEFLLEHRNTKYTSEEMTYYIAGSDNRTRVCLSQLARDGLISCDERSNRGSTKTYYIAFESKKCSVNTSQHNLMGDSISVINFKKVSNKDGETNSAKNDQCINTPRSTTINYPINLGDQLGNPPPDYDTGKVDRLRIENSENFENNAKTPILDAYAINFPQNADQVSNTKLIAEIDVTNNTVINLPDNVDQVSDTKLIAEKTSKVDRPPQKAINLENGFTKNVVPKSPRSAFDDLIPSSYKPVINPLTDKAIEPLLVEKDTKFGAAKSVVLPLKKHKKELAVVINYKFPDGSIATEKHKILNKKEGEALAHEKISYWEQKELLNPSRRYRVRQMGDEEYIWVEGCKLIELAEPPIKQWYVFYSPLGERLRVAGDSEFEVEEL